MKKTIIIIVYCLFAIMQMNAQAVDVSDLKLFTHFELLDSIYHYKNGRLVEKKTNQYDRLGLLLSSKEYERKHGKWEEVGTIISEYDGDGNEILVEFYTINEDEGEIKWYRTKLTREYNECNRTIQSIYYDWSDEGWIKESKSIIEYNNEGKRVLEEDYAWTNDSWEKKGRRIYGYDDQKNKILEENYEGKDNVWIKKSKWQREYNDRNKLILEEKYNAKNNEWVAASKIITTYDEKGNQTSQKRNEYLDDEWIEESCTLGSYLYDNKDRIQTKFYEYWRDGKLINKSKDIYKYEDNNKKELNISYSWEDEEWVNSWKTVYEYNENGSQTFQQNYSWEDGKWVNEDKYITKYDNEGWTPTLDEDYEWENNKWVITDKTIRKYDKNSNLIFKEHYSAENNRKNDGYRIVFKYDTKNRKTKREFYRWTKMGWIKTSKEIYEYPDDDSIIIKTHVRNGLLMKLNSIEYKSIQRPSDLTDKEKEIVNRERISKMLSRDHSLEL